MSTNPDFDWDEVIVSKKPKQKEIDVSFTSDPDLTLGSIEQVDPVERPISSVARPECGQQSCNAAADYQAALAYDDMARCYGVRDEFTFVDTPANIKFRISGTNNFPSAQVLDNNISYNIAVYPMVSSAPVAGAPCENVIDRQYLDATFLNGNTRGNVAFYPRIFEVFSGYEMGPGQNLLLRSVMGNMIYDRTEFGGYYGSPDPARTNFGYMRCVATGKNSSTGLFDGFGAGGFNAGLATSVVTLNTGDGSLSEVALQAESINWNAGQGPGLFDDARESREIRIDNNNFSDPGGEYMPFGTQTGAYMVKMEQEIQMDQTGDSATLRMYQQIEHVKTGRRVQLEFTDSAVNLNGGLKTASPYELWGGFYNASYPISDTENGIYNTQGGMEAVTRYFGGNDNATRSMWLIAYDGSGEYGWDNEDVVRKACIEMERSRPSWEPRDYCSRIQ